jgi:hypothetical protein
VAVCAEEGVLRRLLANRFEGSGQPAIGEAELLCVAVAMMELERADVPVIAAEDACPAGLLDQSLLEVPAPSGHRLGPAAKAAIDAPRLEPELGSAVARAVHHGSVGTNPADSLRVLTARALCAQVVLPEPVPNRPLTEAEPVGDLPGGEAVTNQRRERLTTDTPFGACRSR